MNGRIWCSTLLLLSLFMAGSLCSSREAHPGLAAPRNPSHSLASWFDSPPIGILLKKGEGPFTILGKLQGLSVPPQWDAPGVFQVFDGGLSRGSRRLIIQDEDGETLEGEEFLFAPGGLVSDGPRTGVTPGDLARPVRHDMDGPDDVEVDGKRYRGMVRVLPSQEGMMIVNLISMEQYLYGVVAREMRNGDLEALKAQAVAARTLALGKYLSKDRAPYHLVSTPAQQAYEGAEIETPQTMAAVDETRGLVLFFERELVRYPLYHSTCGGHTERSELVFSSAPVRYLEGKEDTDQEEPFCKDSPYFSWNRVLEEKEVQGALEKAGIPGRIREILPEKTGISGRWVRVLIRTSDGEFPLKGEQLRRILGLPSTLFSLEMKNRGGEDDLPSTAAFVFSGNGWGHGVGMCQWGSIGMARSGKSFREILSHYYPGTVVEDGYERYGLSRSSSLLRQGFYGWLTLEPLSFLTF